MFEITTNLGNTYYVKISRYTLEDLTATQAAAILLGFDEALITKVKRIG